MKIQIYSAYDSKTECFSQPSFLLNKGTALRAWAEAANDRNSTIGKHPADFTFFHIANWDDETGVFETLQAKVNLGTALEFVRQDETKNWIGRTELEDGTVYTSNSKDM